MAQKRVRPRTRETILMDERGRKVPYSNADGSLGILVDEFSPFWARRLRDKDAVEVSDEDNRAAVEKLASEATPAPDAAVELNVPPVDDGGKRSQRRA